MGKDDESYRKPKRKKTRHQTKTPSQSFFWILVLILVSVLAIAGTGGAIWILKYKNSSNSNSDSFTLSPPTAKELPNLLAKLDASEPDWKIEGLESKRRKIEPGQNSSEPIIAAKRLLGRVAIPTEQVNALLDNQPPEMKFTESQAGLIRENLQNVQAALSEAYKVTNLPYGRYSIKFTNDGVSTLLPNAQDARQVNSLINLDATIRGQQNDIEGATRACHAMINVSRSFWDEPVVISQLIRISLREQAFRTLERTLAQGKPSEQALLSLQKLLSEDAAQNLAIVITQGERALNQRMMTALETGELKPETLAALSGQGAHSIKPEEKLDVPLAHAWMLWYTNHFLEIARLPYHEQQNKLDALNKFNHNIPEILKFFTDGLTKGVEACRRSQAKLSCTLAAIATERYRIKNGRWPDSLKQLVPEQLTEIPSDPYTGQPLHFGKHSHGIVIYSVGKDLKDNNGMINYKTPGAEGTDIGFRLWNPEDRHQIPR